MVVTGGTVKSSDLVSFLQDVKAIKAMVITRLSLIIFLIVKFFSLINNQGFVLNFYQGLHHWPE